MSMTIELNIKKDLVKVQDENVWLVRSENPEKSKEFYTVAIEPVCNCPDFEYRHSKFCKHIKKVINEWKGKANGNRA